MCAPSKRADPQVRACVKCCGRRKNNVFDSLEGLTRSHSCGDLRAAANGAEVVLMGWVQRRRDHGGLIFVDLRDREGLTQVVFNPKINPDTHIKAGVLRDEYVIAVRGLVNPPAAGDGQPESAHRGDRGHGGRAAHFERRQDPALRAGRLQGGHLRGPAAEVPLPGPAGAPAS